MAVIILDESPLGKELIKWETPKREGGMRANGFEEYPKMLYRARPNANGAFLVFDLVGERSIDVQRVEEARTFNASNILKVGSEGEELDALSRGWRPSVQAAIDLQLQRQESLSTAAAEANFKAKSMSELAQRELMAANAATSEHVTDVPVKKRRGRKPRVADVV